MASALCRMSAQSRQSQRRILLPRFSLLLADSAYSGIRRLLCRVRYSRRTCARVCHQAGGELDQIQFLFAHVSVQTTEHTLAASSGSAAPSTIRSVSSQNADRLRPVMDGLPTARKQFVNTSTSAGIGATAISTKFRVPHRLQGVRRGYFYCEC